VNRRKEREREREQNIPTQKAIAMHEKEKWQ
jgi:hypothetical protein